MIPISVCVGCGLFVDAGLLKVQTNPNGCLVCDDTNGLAVEVSPDDCNALICRGNGLWALCPDSFSCIQTVEFYGGAIIGVPDGLASGSYDLLSQCIANACSSCPGGTDGRIRFCNNSPCCTLEGFWDVQAYGGQVATNPGFNATAELFISTNGGAFVGASPVTLIRMQNNTAAVQTFNLSGLMDRNYISLPAGTGTCVDLQAMVRILVLAGTGTWESGPTFEFHFGPLTQRGCC